MMKKLLLVMLVLAMVFGSSAALAMDMGVQVIGEPETEAEPVSLDDIQLNSSADISGYGTITPTAFQYKNIMSAYSAGKGDDPYYGGQNFESGNEAEYAVLFMDILNTTTKSMNYLADCTVTVIFDDTYEFAGWCYQQNYNNATYKDIYRGGVEEDKGKQNVNWVIDEADNFVIDPMYKGHYVFGCTIPNASVESKAPLKMIITIDGNEITYNIRK